MKKFFKVVGVLLGVAGVAGCVYFAIQYNTVKSEKEVLIQQNAQLQSNIDAIGPITTAYTVAVDVENGNVIGADDFVEMTVPVSSVTETTILNIDDIVGKLYKIDIQPGTTVTSDMVMTNDFSETVYEKDMGFDYLPLGIEVGDYVDVKISLPYGETFVVMQHKRVEQVVLDTNVIKTYLTPAQQALWESAMRDKALYGGIGVSLYVDKYVEPGVQNDTNASYPVRQEVAAVVMVDRNITDKKECVNNTLRQSIDQMLEAVVEEDGSKLQSGVSSEASQINSSVSLYTENTTNKSDVTGDDSTTGDIDLDSYSGVDDLQELDSTLSSVTESTDVIVY
jgi:hypothetical protein